MARATVFRRLSWRSATVLGTRTEGARARTLILSIPEWDAHLPGQHVDVRLTASDGYQAQRSYSVASAPEDDLVELAVENVPDGEVSPYLVEQLEEGDVLDLRGPVGGDFTWKEELGGPLLLIAGGAGIVPLRSMIRHQRSTYSEVPVRLLYSARSIDDALYRSEVMGWAASDEIDVNLVLTRVQPPGWRGYQRRIDQSMLDEVAWDPGQPQLTYICGPTSFVESAANLLVQAGHNPSRIRIERFGGTP